MKQSSFSHLFIKAVFTVAALTAMAKAAFAQITLDWDVLTEETPVKENTSAASRNVPIPLKAPSVKKEAPPRLIPVKPVPAVKPEVKPASKPTIKAPVKPEVKPTATPVSAVKKNVKQTTEKTPLRPKEKYQVKETQPKDEHDRLKPHAAPVPEVKILEAKNNDGSADSRTAKEKTVQTGEPRISKHFLEQQRLKEQRKKEQTVSDEPAVQSSVSEAVSSVLPQEQPKPQAATPEQLMESVLKSGAVKTEPEKLPVQPVAVVKETAKEIPVKTPAVPEKDKITYSVVPVSDSLTQEERSSVLSLEIPSNSATFKALSAQRTLYAVFRFEKKSLELTHEMQTVLNDIAVQMKKNKKKRLIVYSYGSSDPVEPGKERQYALRRALQIRSYLIEQGLHSLRIELRSQGQKGAGNKIPDRADLVFQER